MRRSVPRRVPICGAGEEEEEVREVREAVEAGRRGEEEEGGCAGRVYHFRREIQRRAA